MLHGADRPDRGIRKLCRFQIYAFVRFKYGLHRHAQTYIQVAVTLCVEQPFPDLSRILAMLHKHSNLVHRRSFSMKVYMLPRFFDRSGMLRFSCHARIRKSPGPLRYNLMFVM